MADMVGQVIIPASGIVCLAQGIQQPNVGGPGPLASNLWSIGDIQFQQLLVQNNNGSGNFRLGDWSVTATRGLLILPTGSGNFGALINYASMLSDWFVFGAAAAIVDFLYIK